MGAYPNGLLGLLSRLIIDSTWTFPATFTASNCSPTSPERFDRSPLDYVMLSVASVLLMRPHTSSYRFQTATSLWYNYGDMFDGHASEHEEFQGLVYLFIFTVFGRHVSLDEVNAWPKVEKQRIAV